MASRTAPKRPRQEKQVASPLTATDFRSYLLAKAAEVAPEDVSTLVARADDVRTRLAAESASQPGMEQRGRVALDLLADHVGGECPQIPLHTVAVLTAALFYFLDRIDVVPDCIPGAGLADDALVLELACKVSGRGLQRYLDWKGIASALAATVKPPARRPAPARRPSQAKRR